MTSWLRVIPDRVYGSRPRGPASLGRAVGEGGALGGFDDYALADGAAVGPTGAVSWARHVPSGQAVAVTELADEAAANEAFVGRLRSTAEALSTVGHPNVLAIREVVEGDGRVWVVEDWVDGRELGQVLSDGPLTAEQSVALACGVLRGLEAVQKRWVVHGDISPASIVLGTGGVPRLVGFGFAGLPRWGPADATTDVMAVASVLRDLLAGTTSSTRHKKLDAAVDDATSARDKRRPKDAATFLAMVEKAAKADFGKDWEATTSLAALAVKAPADVPEELVGPSPEASDPTVISPAVDVADGPEPEAEDAEEVDPGDAPEAAEGADVAEDAVAEEAAVAVDDVPEAAVAVDDVAAVDESGTISGDSGESADATEVEPPPTETDLDVGPAASESAAEPEPAPEPEAAEPEVEAAEPTLVEAAGEPTEGAEPVPAIAAATPPDAAEGFRGPDESPGDAPAPRKTTTGEGTGPRAPRKPPPPRSTRGKGKVKSKGKARTGPAPTAAAATTAATTAAMKAAPAPPQAPAGPPAPPAPTAAPGRPPPSSTRVRVLAGLIMILLGAGTAVAVDRNQTSDERDQVASGTSTPGATSPGASTPGGGSATDAPTTDPPTLAEIASSDVVGSWRMQLAVFESTGFFGTQVGQTVEKVYTIRSDCSSGLCVLKLMVSGTTGEFELRRQGEEYVLSASAPRTASTSPRAPSVSPTGAWRR